MRVRVMAAVFTFLGLTGLVLNSVVAADKAANDRAADRRAAAADRTNDQAKIDKKNRRRRRPCEPDSWHDRTQFRR